ncbi:MAG TPA: hypothetical protein VJ001_02075 [Rhodocyclaceae bacterium]|nr:hypothetical protein [Rhodocyclaceae bacterium]
MIGSCSLWSTVDVGIGDNWDAAHPSRQRRLLVPGIAPADPEIVLEEDNPGELSPSRR